MGARHDPYELLGVPRGADLEQIRAAYRRAALRCHPDNSPHDPAEAHRRFCRLTEAYQRLCAALGRDCEGAEGPSGRPGRWDFGWPIVPPGEAGPALETVCRGRLLAQKFRRPSLDETRAFAWYWAAAVLVSGVAAFWAPGLLGLGIRAGGKGILLMAAVTLGTYAAAIVAALVAVVSTRRVFWLVRHLAFLGRLALPLPPARPRRRLIARRP